MRLRTLKLLLIATCVSAAVILYYVAHHINDDVTNSSMVNEINMQVESYGQRKSGLGSSRRSLSKLQVSAILFCLCVYDVA